MKDLIKEVAKKLDNQLDFKKLVPGIGGTILEFLDGNIFEMSLTFLAGKLPEEYLPDLEALLKAYVSGDYSKVESTSIKRLNSAIDIPILDEGDEEILLDAVVGAFFKIVEKKRNESS